MFVVKLFDSDVIDTDDCMVPSLTLTLTLTLAPVVVSLVSFWFSSYPLLVTVTSFQLLTYCRLPIRLPILVTDLFPF